MEKKRPPRSRALLEYEFQRAYKACTPCSKRKVKCEPGDGGRCLRCSEKRIECTFTAKKPWSRAKHTEQSQRNDSSRSQGAQLECQQRTRTKQGGLPTSMLEKVVSNDNDAMNILYEAALREESHDVPGERRVTNSASRVPRTLTDTDALHIWNACRFVKMGWFTASEAMNLVDLFFTNMSPLSPILTDFYASHKNQFYLVTQEPLLCCTILMISSRHHTLPGVGGCSRAFFIHQRLWQHCQHLLVRLTLGQEKFSKGKTRNIGSIEALLLMSEWYPRHLQFPPETDGWDSDFILTTLDSRDPPLPTEDTPVSDRWKQDVVEPTKRFERMSWMVLNLALGLAHELGAFDTNVRVMKPDDLVGVDAKMYLEHLELRRQRLPSLLFVFINTLSARLGCTSPMPSDAAILPPDSRLLRTEKNGMEWLAFMKSWTELTKLTTSIMDTLFPLMKISLTSGSADALLSILEQKQILIANWRRRNLNGAFPGARLTDILFIEHQHLRVLVNSIGMQLAVQRVLLQNNTYGESTIDYSFIEKARRVNMTAQEYRFIEEVIDDCCQALEKVATLGAIGHLYFSPMRVLFRTISFSIFLMKALALGVRNTKLQEALHMLDRVIAALQDNNQDDVHLKFQYATLLQAQASRLRGGLVSSHSTKNYSEAHSTQVVGSLQAPETFQSTAQLAGFHGEGIPSFELDDLIDLDVNDWLSLQFDPSMAPFSQNDGEFGARLDGIDLDLDFLWQLPP